MPPPYPVEIASDYGERLLEQLDVEITGKEELMVPPRQRNDDEPIMSRLRAIQTGQAERPNQPLTPLEENPGGSMAHTLRRPPRSPRPPGGPPPQDTGSVGTISIPASAGVLVWRCYSCGAEFAEGGPSHHCSCGGAIVLRPKDTPADASLHSVIGPVEVTTPDGVTQIVVDLNAAAARVSEATATDRSPGNSIRINNRLQLTAEQRRAIIRSVRDSWGAVNVNPPQPPMPFRPFGDRDGNASHATLPDFTMSRRLISLQDE